MTEDAGVKRQVHLLGAEVLSFAVGAGMNFKTGIPVSMNGVVCWPRPVAADRSTIPSLATFTAGGQPGEAVPRR
ncbi:hypothetical protein JZ751_016198, partial [Albula glossodonta]